MADSIESAIYVIGVSGRVRGSVWVVFCVLVSADPWNVLPDEKYYDDRNRAAQDHCVASANYA